MLFYFFPMVKRGPNKMGCKQKQGKCTRHTKAKRKTKYELPVAKHKPKPKPNLTTNPRKQRLVFLIELQKHVNKALILGQSTSITPPIKSYVFSFPITQNKKKNSFCSLFEVTYYCPNHIGQERTWVSYHQSMRPT